ncbi:transmembrane protein [Cystoisospora suis]|uniref:Transmembrane protein n=1 Tax=Cystoisospora suis TaxID=483139 RepID=A0A2C6KPF4_9APIC|nr:transmembrane protein [Cystoisospora suis]
MLRTGAPAILRRPCRLSRHHYANSTEACSLPAIKEERDEDGCSEDTSPPRTPVQADLLPPGGLVSENVSCPDGVSPAGKKGINPVYLLGSPPMPATVYAVLGVQLVLVFLLLAQNLGLKKESETWDLRISTLQSTIAALQRHNARSGRRRFSWACMRDDFPVQTSDEEASYSSNERRGIKRCHGVLLEREEKRLLVDFHDKFTHTQQRIRNAVDSLVKKILARLKIVSELADDVFASNQLNKLFGHPN